MKRRWRESRSCFLPAADPASGMTLIELMTTLLIVGLLMASSLGVVTRMSQTQEIVLRTDNPLEPSLRSLLAGDVRNAERYRKTPGGFVLRTHAALDDKNRELKHLPTTVTYETMRIDSRSWLVRRQQLDGAARSVDLVCADVRGISFRALDEQPSRSRGAWQAVPEAVVISVEFNGDDRAPMEFIYRVR